MVSVQSVSTRFNPITRNIMLVLGAALTLAACGVEDGENTIGGSDGEVIEGVYCATPKFAATGPSEGDLYVCNGYADSAFEYVACELNCNGDPSIEPIGRDTDGHIPFPPEVNDPTEGANNPDGVDLYACCDPAVEMAGAPGSVEGVEACVSACAYKACSEAEARFEALLADPNTWAACGPLTACQNRVKQSLEHYKGFIHDNFEACVASVIDADPGTEFKMPNPGCAEEIGAKPGCLIGAVLDISCHSVSIDFDSEFGSCAESPDQAPEVVPRSCDIEGEVEISDAAGFITKTFDSGSVSTLLYPCSDTLCPYILEDLSVEVPDIDAGAQDYTDLTVRLYMAAIGHTDGQDVEFPIGALRVRVSGNIVDAAGSVPFDVLTSNTAPVYATIDVIDAMTDEVTFTDFEFEAGSYTFVASLEPLMCEAP